MPHIEQFGHCRPHDQKRKLESESGRVGITPSVSYKPYITYSFGIPFSLHRFLNSSSPCIYLVFCLADRPPSLLRFWFHQSPAGDRTIFPHHHDSHNSATCTPSCVDSRRRYYNKYQARGSSLRQWPQANLTYIDRLIGCAQCVVVWLSSSTEAQSCSITFSSTTHYILGDLKRSKD